MEPEGGALKRWGWPTKGLFLMLEACSEDVPSLALNPKAESPLDL